MVEARSGFDEILKTLPTASAVLDRSLHYLAVNQRWRDSYRLGDTPLVGRDHRKVFPELPQDWLDVLDRCLAGATESRTGDRFVRRDGTTDYVDWTVAPWHQADGTVGGVVLHTEVVTNHLQLRRQLEESEAFVRALFDKSPIGMNLCQLDGLWLASNPAFLDIIGYSAAEADGGLTYWQLTPREYDDSEQVQLRALETTGRYGPYEKEFIRKDGRRIPVRLNGFLIERGGEQFIWSLIEDISHQRDLERNLDLQRAQALQAAKLASIGEMAAGIAHEINNPLQIIENFAFMIERAQKSGQELPAEAASGIREATDRAARIVRGLLKFAREDTGTLETQQAQKIARESLDYTAARMRNHGVTVTESIESERSIQCSRVELLQVLINLLNNAYDAVRPERGEVELTVRDDGDDVLFLVRDSGPGVPEEIRDRLFQPFVTSKAHGTGLGLSVSRGIVESVSGTIDYERRDGKTLFTVRIPAAGAR